MMIQGHSTHGNCGLANIQCSGSKRTLNKPDFHLQTTCSEVCPVVNSQGRVSVKPKLSPAGGDFTDCMLGSDKHRDHEAQTKTVNAQMHCVFVGVCVCSFLLQFNDQIFFPVSQGLGITSAELHVT